MHTHMSILRKCTARVASMQSLVFYVTAACLLQNVAKLPSVMETALATMSETPLPAVVNQILDEKKLDDPELVRASAQLCVTCALWNTCVCCVTLQVADATSLKESLDANLRVLT